MSLATGARGELVVVDQVNARLLTIAPDGGVSAMRIGEGAQDAAVARDGTIAVLDRLGDRAVTLYGRDGRAIGALPIEGRGVGEAGGVTGVFVDGDDVYVEREHGQLVRVGDVRGDSGGERSELPGRPSRDGSSFVSAFLDAGRAFVSATTRATMQHRYTRALPLAAPATAILLLDTDARGTLYVATREAQGDGSEGLELTCASLDDGRAIGSTPMAPNAMPEETFRELVVLDDGGVLHAEMSEGGVAYVRYDCR